MKLTSLQTQCLTEMDIQVWRSRVANKTKQTTPTETAKPDLAQLEKQIAKCTNCSLHKTRTQTVFGIGNPQAELMIIGEAPGYYEDQQGEPFVGRAGQLLNSMMTSIGLSRDEIFIANILKCRPPNNRDPLPEEISQCTGHLLAQINLIKPKVLCAVGRIAGQYLLDTQLSLGKLRNKVHQYSEAKIPLLITYHPAYLLRNPAMKNKAYLDLLSLKQLLSDNVL